MSVKTIRVTKHPLPQPMVRLVQGDANTQVLRFLVKKDYGGTDLTALVWSVWVQGYDGEAEVSYAGTGTVSGDDLQIDWTVIPAATKAAGVTILKLCGSNAGEDSTEYQWVSGNMQINVTPTQMIDPGYDEDEVEEVRQLITEFGQKNSELTEYIDDLKNNPEKLLTDGIVSTVKIADGAVETEKIADKAVTIAKLSDDLKQNHGNTSAELQNSIIACCMSYMEHANEFWYDCNGALGKTDVEGDRHVWRRQTATRACSDDYYKMDDDHGAWVIEPWDLDHYWDDTNGSVQPVTSNTPVQMYAHDCSEIASLITMGVDFNHSRYVEGGTNAVGSMGYGYDLFADYTDEEDKPWNVADREHYVNTVSDGLASMLERKGMLYTLVEGSGKEKIDYSNVQVGDLIFYGSSTKGRSSTGHYGLNHTAICVAKTPDGGIIKFESNQPNLQFAYTNVIPFFTKGWDCVYIGRVPLGTGRKVTYDEQEFGSVEKSSTGWFREFTNAQSPITFGLVRVKYKIPELIEIGGITPDTYVYVDISGKAKNQLKTEESTECVEAWSHNNVVYHAETMNNSHNAGEIVEECIPFALMATRINHVALNKWVKINPPDIIPCTGIRVILEGNSTGTKQADADGVPCFQTYTDNIISVEFTVPYNIDADMIRRTENGYGVEFRDNGYTSCVTLLDKQFNVCDIANNVNMHLYGLHTVTAVNVKGDTPTISDAPANGASEESAIVKSKLYTVSGAVKIEMIKMTTWVSYVVYITAKTEMWVERWKSDITDGVVQPPVLTHQMEVTNVIPT